MAEILQYFPGMQATVFLEIKDGYGIRVDSSSMPLVTRIIFPGFTLASNYPQQMQKLDTGLYYAQFVLPTGAAAVGSYLVDTLFTNPINGMLNNKIFQIVVNAPFGNFSTTIGN